MYNNRCTITGVKTIFGCFLLPLTPFMTFYNLFSGSIPVRKQSGSQLSSPDLGHPEETLITTDETLTNYFCSGKDHITILKHA